MSNVIEIDTGKIEALGAKLSRIDSESLGRASVRALNLVVNRGFKLGVRSMLTGVNLPESYVTERMAVEEATDPSKPVAKIIAFRPGGKKGGIKPVNLRQYDPRRMLTTNNWSNSGVATDSGKRVFSRNVADRAYRKGGSATVVIDGKRVKSKEGGFGPNPKLNVAVYENPRKPGTKLPFIPRVGNRVLGIPVGQKVESISVEVIKGQRKLLRPVNGFAAFMQRMPNGEVLVMRRTSKNGGKNGKGQIEALYSLSVAQLFNFIAKKETDKARKYKDELLGDLEATVSNEILEEIQKAVNE